jgi:predicted O-linked N-acetylglucosamine transferase (SPINDLY family)
MGVPVLTLLGQTHAGRVSASLLTTISQPSDIAESESDYITKAIQHIDAGKRTKESRESLRDQLLNSSLCDQIPYTRKVEDAYRTLWKQWCASK